ncbi:DUF4224 domain-containing protein [Litorivivens sp.]|uniref:DUF4224 domain-containing protein n=1 Tax=Litorivivens sp. TaxID=2020868 RepID=UPI003568A7A6
MLLTEEEIVELTGYCKPALQRKQLEKMEIPFRVGRNGRPKILKRSLYDQFATEPMKNSGRRVGPNFNALEQTEA